MNHKVLKIAVMASGAGSTFQALCEAKGPWQVVGLIVSQGGIGATEKAKKLNVPVFVATTDAEIILALENLKPDIIVLAGYLKKISPPILAKYKNKILNTHPSLLPKYGGKGMYGKKVHAAVIAAKETETGVTIHWVNEAYDEGPHIAQKRIPVLASDTPESLETRLKVIEKDFLLETLKKVHGTFF